MKNMALDTIATITFCLLLYWLYSVQGIGVVIVVAVLWFARAMCMAISYKLLCEHSMLTVIRKHRPAMTVVIDMVKMPWEVFWLEFVRAFFFPTWRLPHVISKCYRLDVNLAWYEIKELDEKDWGRYPFRAMFVVIKNTNIAVCVDETGYHEGTYAK